MTQDDIENSISTTAVALENILYKRKSDIENVFLLEGIAWKTCFYDME